MEERTELTLLDNELVIDNKTKLRKIQNKEKYTKLILKTPKVKLDDFINAREIVIDYNVDFSIYNKYFFPYAENIKFTKKIHFDKTGLVFKAPNLKSIEFSKEQSNLNQWLLENTPNIEELTFNLYDNHSIGEVYPALLITSNTKLKTIIIKYRDKSYKINLDYTPDYIKQISFYDFIIKISYGMNKYIKSYTSITNEELNQVTNEFYMVDDSNIKDGTLYIPDYINNIDIIEKKSMQKIKEISLNTNSFDGFSGIFRPNIEDYKDLKKITIRTNNDMKLFGEQTIEVTEESGKITYVFVSGNKLHIKFEKYLLTVDKEGQQQKEEYKEKDATNQEIIDDDSYNKMTSYTSKQLRYYTHLKEIIEYMQDSKNKDLDNALSTVEKNLIKKFEMENNRK